MKKMNLAIGAFVLIIAAALLIPAAMAAPATSAATGVCDGDQDQLQDGSCGNCIADNVDPSADQLQNQTRICAGEDQGTMTQMRAQMQQMQMTGDGQGQMSQNRGMNCGGQ
jgi:hypothetical protein